MPCDGKEFFSLAYGFKSEEVERLLSRKLSPLVDVSNFRFRTANFARRMSATGRSAPIGSLISVAASSRRI